MNPIIALDFTHDSIRLLHHMGEDFKVVDQVELTHDDIIVSMARLRQKAVELAGENFTSKLLIPPSQILHSTLQNYSKDNKTDHEQTRQKIEASLIGKTPYEVKDLVYDYDGPDSSDQLHIFVVAQVTLDEARSFAEQHSFNPVCFGAHPNEDFQKIPDFGAIFEPQNAVTPSVTPTVTPSVIPVAPPPIETAPLVATKNHAPSLKAHGAHKKQRHNDTTAPRDHKDSTRPYLIAEPPEQSTRDQEAESLTIFGARKGQKLNKKQKSNIFLLIFTLILLAGLAALIYFFMFSEQRKNTLNTAEDPFEAAIHSETAQFSDESAGDEAFLSLEDSAAITGAITGTITGTLIDDQSDLADVAPEALSPSAAQARYAATGIWQKAPAPLTDPKTDSLSGLYIASIDNNISSVDAIALPGTSQIDLANTIINTVPPLALGFEQALDNDGHIQATTQGTLTQDGVLVFSGAPKIKSKIRPNIEQQTQVTTQDQQRPKLRPQPRPSGLVEDNERTQFGGRTRFELAVMRPKARPVTLITTSADQQANAVLSALENDRANAGNPSLASLDTGTAFSVSHSAPPQRKPKNFAQIAKQQNARSGGSDGSSVSASASPQQTIAPKIPTTASVAKQATMKNAISLRKVSLIGIYGTKSDRRALVRLPSGRYVKVKKGSRLDGGRVQSITAKEVVYKKGSRSYTLEVLPFG